MYRRGQANTDDYRGDSASRNQRRDYQAGIASTVHPLQQKRPHKLDNFSHVTSATNPNRRFQIPGSSRIGMRNRVMRTRRDSSNVDGK